MGKAAQEERATQLLENPLLYPGLPQKKRPRVLLRLWHYPAFEPHASWVIIEDDTKYFLRRVVWDQRVDIVSPEPQTYATEAPINKCVLDELMNKLQGIELPPFIPVDTVGIDGVRNGLEFGSYMASARLSWWCDPPPQWAPLQSWHNDAIDVLEQLLPSSAAYLHRDSP